VHGGAGLSQDTELASMYAHARVLRIADGPDEVHYRSIARMELHSQNQSKLWKLLSIAIVLTSWH